MKTAVACLLLIVVAVALWHAGPPPASAARAVPPARSQLEPVFLSARPATADYASIHEKLRSLDALDTEDSAGRAKLQAELLTTLTDENAPDVILALTPAELASPFGVATLTRWLKTDPLAAAQWIAGQPDATDEHRLAVARRLAASPALLQDHLDELPDGPWKQGLLADAGRELAGQSPAEALHLADQMDPGEGRKDLFETVAYAWAVREPKAALSWISTIDDPLLREQLSAMGAKAIAVTDPDLAAEWLATAVKSGPAASDTALCLAETWAVRDPAKAAAWAAQLGDLPRAAAVETVARRWLETDFEAAFRWVQTLPEREKILAGLSAGDSDPGDPGV